MVDRMSRVSELIKREISMIVQTDIEDPKLFGVTITRVEVTRDLGSAKVYVTLPEGTADVSARIKLLTTYARFIRGELAGKVVLKHVPRLSFREDMLEAHSKSVDDLFDRISKERGGMEQTP